MKYVKIITLFFLNNNMYDFYFFVYSFLFFRLINVSKFIIYYIRLYSFYYFRLICFLNMIKNIYNLFSIMI